MPFVLTRDCGVRAEHHGLQALSVTFVQILAQQVPPCDGALETASVRMKGPSCEYYVVRSYPGLWCACGTSWLTGFVGYFCTNPCTAGPSLRWRFRDCFSQDEGSFIWKICLSFVPGTVVCVRNIMAYKHCRLLLYKSLHSRPLPAMALSRLLQSG